MDWEQRLAITREAFYQQPLPEGVMVVNRHHEPGDFVPHPDSHVYRFCPVCFVTYCALCHWELPGRV